jgi:hypothetical protein
MSHRSPSRPRVFLLPAILLAVCLATLTLPEPRLQAATCGVQGNIVCRESTTCMRFLIFYFNCSTTYEYLGDWDEEPEEAVAA